MAVCLFLYFTRKASLRQPFVDEIYKLVIYFCLSVCYIYLLKKSKIK